MCIHIFICVMFRKSEFLRHHAPLMKMEYNTFVDLSFYRVIPGEAELYILV